MLSLIIKVKSPAIYRLIMYPTNSYVKNLIPKVMIAPPQRQGLWEVIKSLRQSLWMGLVSCKRSPREIFAPSTTWGHSNKSTVCNPKEGLQRNPTMPTSLFCTSSLQNCVVSAQTVIFCYSSLYRLRQVLRIIITFLFNGKMEAPKWEFVLK